MQQPQALYLPERYTRGSRCKAPFLTFTLDLLSSLADLEAPRPSPKIMYRGREFVLYTNQLSFYAAAAFCALKGDRLAVVDQQEIAKKISELMIINRPSKPLKEFSRLSIPMKSAPWSHEVVLPCII